VDSVPLHSKRKKKDGAFLFLTFRVVYDENGYEVWQEVAGQWLQHYWAEQERRIVTKVLYKHIQSLHSLFHCTLPNPMRILLTTASPKYAQRHLVLFLPQIRDTEISHILCSFDVSRRTNRRR
jgi:hypothetical protein